MTGTPPCGKPANIYNVLSVGFNKFHKILFLNAAVYCLSEGLSEEVSDGSPDSCESGLETILYLESSQAPKSISLHRLEQKGKNVACLDWS